MYIIPFYSIYYYFQSLNASNKYSAPGLRWFLASNLETSAVWVCGVRGAGNLTTLKFTSKGRAPCACGAGGQETQDPWWCGGSHPPDMDRPTYGRARMVYAG